MLSAAQFNAAIAAAGGDAKITAFMLGDNRLFRVGDKGRYEFTKDDTNQLITFTPKDPTATTGLPYDPAGEIIIATFEDVKAVNFIP